MTPHEQQLTRQVGQLRAEITRLRLEIARAKEPVTEPQHLMDATMFSEAQAWLDWIGPDPHAGRHLAVLTANL
jgi:hypothetical protein